MRVCACAGGKLQRSSEGWTEGDVAALRLRLAHRPPAFAQLLQAMLAPNPAQRPSAQQVVAVVQREQPAIAAIAAATVAATAAAAAASRSSGGDLRSGSSGGSMLPPPPLPSLRLRGSGAAGAAAGASNSSAHLVPSPFVQPAEPWPPAPRREKDAAAMAVPFSFDVPAAAAASQRPRPAAGYAFAAGPQPLRPHNRGPPAAAAAAPQQKQPPPPSSAVKGTPPGRGMSGGGSGSRWAPSLSPLVSEGTLTPGALAALTGEGLSPSGGECGAPTPVMAPPVGSGSGRAPPLEVWRPTPLQLPISGQSGAGSGSGLLPLRGQSSVAAAGGGSVGLQQLSSSGTQDSREGWRLSRRDVLSPDSERLAGEGWGA